MEKIHHTVDAMSFKALGLCHQPAVIFNPNASAEDLMAWVDVELTWLGEFLHMAATSRHDAPMDLHEFAELLSERLEPIGKAVSRAAELEPHRRTP